MNISLDALRDDLTDLRQALDDEDFRRAGDVLALHDRRLRQFVDSVGRQSPLAALRGLLQLQHRFAGATGPLAEPGT